MLKTIGKLAILTTAVLSIGCASVDKAPATADSAAKQFKSNPNYAQVYVYRDEILGSALRMDVAVNGKPAGETASKSYFKFDLPAGTHTFTSQGDDEPVKLQTRNGGIYYLWQEMKMSMLAPKSDLQVVEDTVGKKGVLASTMIQSKL